MNPGDLYNPDPNSPNRRGPYSPSRPNGSQPFPGQQQQQYQPGRQPTFPPPNPYDNLAPAGPRPFPQSQSTPYMSGPAPPYADPFHDNAGPSAPGPAPPPPQDQWSGLPGSRHYQSYPALPISPPPGHQGRPSLPAQTQPLAIHHTGPQQQQQQQLAPPHMASPPRTRFDSNVSYHSAANTPPISQAQPYGLGDDRLTSPPPLLPHHSSASSSVGYPPRPMGMQHANSNQYGQQDDDMDSAPLLNHATADPRFGVPPRGGTPARFQLQDNGDVGVLPNRWRHDGGLDNGSQNGQPYGYGLGGGHELPTDDSNVHYGPLPTRVLRRNRTQKKVNLFHGHLVLDVEVPSMYMDKVPQRDELEFSKMRYTAITCDPNDFVDDRYTLRQKLYDPPRQTELFIVVTMYNEDDLLFCRTMRGVFQNIAHLCTRTKSKTWGKEGWKKVVVCVVADGRLKINPRTRSVLAALGVYQDGVGTNVVNGKPVTAHLYEYTTQLWIDSGNKLQAPDPSRHVPVQIIFCMKEKNQKKINSHRWFFNAFGACLRPNVCVLLDVGTQPGPDSIYHLWKAFDINSSVGGACGEIVALKGMFWKNLLNPLVAAQNFEYKMSNILDKPLESIFGYISVLPGAFSAYRYIALLNDDKGNGPLKQYFLGETMHGSDAGIFAANMYLAEDRILCWELVSKRGCKWILHYVKSAYAITDVPDRVPELVSQRRRWLNGSFFAAIHSTFHFGYLYRSSKFFLHIEFLYQFISLFFSWFALGNFFIAFVVLTNSLDTLGPAWKYVNIPLQYGYAALLLLCFLLALGNRPAGSVVGYTISMIGFALLTVYMIFAAVYLAVIGIQSVTQEGVTVDTVFGNTIFRNIVLSLLATYGLYIISSLLALEPWHMITSFLQYLLLAPSYINVLNVYAFSNVHDVSWGTKGSDKVSEDLGVVKSDDKNEVTVLVPTEQKDLNALYENEMQIINSKPPKEEKNIAPDQKQEDYYKNFRTNVLLAWTMSNAALAAVILQTSSGSGSVATTYMGVLLYTVAGLAFFRFLGSTAYLIVRLFAGE